MLAYTREQLVTHLLETPEIFKLYQAHDPLFADRVVVWLSQTEETLLKLRLPAASRLAAERGSIVAAGEGYRDPALGPERVSGRRAVQITAVLALERAQTELARTINEIDAKFETWREKMAQFLAVATTSRPIPLPPTEPREDWLNSVWANLRPTDETGSMYNYLNTVMPASDRRYLLQGLMINLLDT